MRCAVVGPSVYPDEDKVREALNNHKNKISVLLIGPSEGVDAIAREYAIENNIPVEMHIPEHMKNLDVKFDPEYCFKNCKKMVEKSNALLVFDGVDRHSTGFMVDYAKRLSRTIYHYR